MEEDRKSRNKLLHAPNVMNRGQRNKEYTIKTVSSISGAGKTGQLYIKK